jgi:acetoin utilization deacetylase AcuC-like enzyme
MHRRVTIFDPSKFQIAGTQNISKWLSVSKKLHDLGHDIKPSIAISVNDLLLVHTPRYVDAFLTNKLSNDEVRRIGLGQWSSAVVDRVMNVCGSTMQAASLVAHERSVNNLVWAVRVCWIFKSMCILTLSTRRG